MKTQNFIQSRFCFYSAHKCLLQKELMDLELVSGLNTEKNTRSHCYNNFQQNWDFKCNKISLFRQRQILNLFPKSQLHNPCIFCRTLLSFGSCHQPVPQGNGLFSLNQHIWGHIMLCPWRKCPTRTKWLISNSNAWLSADIHPGPLSPGSCEAP